MTLEQKARAYDKALETIKKLQEVNLSDEGIQNRVNENFPELKDSKDERIRKELITHCRNTRCVTEEGAERIAKWIAWLEKQDDNKSVKNIVETWKDMRLEVYQQASGNRHEPNYSDDTTKMFSLNDIDEIIEKMSEQKSYDKVEIKFKIEKGKWYVCIKDLLDNYANKAFYKGDTYLSTQDGSLMPSNSNIPFEVVCPDTYFRDWTIQDAKEGDVLVTKYNQPFIYNGNYDLFNVGAYCGMDCLGEIFIESSTYCQWSSNDVKPATKEQRDALMKAMADAGYTFDFEKKELKKNEDEEYNGEDYGIDSLYRAQTILEETLGKVDGYQSDDGILEHKCAITAIKKLYKKKSAWSEEDERICNTIIDDIVIDKSMCKYEISKGICNVQINWLKSLKQRIGE